MTTLIQPWRYKEGATGHDSGFQASAFDDSSWSQGDQPFGLNDLAYDGPINTPWPGHNDDLCIRAHLDVAADTVAVQLRVRIDYSGEVWVNGASVGTVLFSDNPYKVFNLSSWNVGDNVIAVRANADDQQNRVQVAVAITPPAEPNAWDVFDAGDLLGSPIATLENAKGRYIRSELHGFGEGGFAINRHAAEATEAILAEGNMIKVRIADCGPDYLDGFFLPGDGDYTLLSGQGGQGKEDLVFRGDGALSYLDRARMLPCSYSLEDINGTWTKIWAATAIARPVGAAFDSAQPGYVYVGGISSRKVHKLNQSTLTIAASSAALWSGSDKYMGGISLDPDDATIMWVLEAPWLSGSGANTKIRKYSRAASGVPGTLLATYDLGSAVQLTDIRVDGDYVWTSRYDNDRIQQRSKSNPATVVNSSTITYKGKVQRKPNGIAINGTKVAYWFGGDAGGGTGRALIADTSAYTTITGVQNTKNVSAFGGEWTTEGGEDFLYAVSYTAGKTWKYQLTDAEPRCADDSGTFHPDQVAPGAIAWRVLVEITHPDRPSQPVSELSFDFTETADSNGTAWPARTSTEEFTWRVGDRAYSDVLARLIPAGVTFDFDVNTMTLHAYVDADFGTDRTAASFGAGKVRFVEAVNLAVNGDLGRRDNRGLPATYITVLGDGAVYGDATLSGRYVREGFMQVSGPSTEAVLDAIGDDELARERLVADALGFETLWAVETADATFDDLALLGRYVPFRHYWKGDVVRVDMTAGEFAYNETDFRVYGTLINERDGGWRSAVDLGSAYKIPEPIDSTGGDGSNASSGGGGSAGGSTVITSIPLTFENEDGSVAIPRVTKVIAEGVTSPSPGVAVLPDPSAAIDPPLLEELLTDETDTTLVPHPTGDGGVEWGRGGTDLDWFNVKDYGALGDGSTDDTAAIQATVDAAYSAGGGTIYFPPGLYIIGGALQDTGAFNAQILLPNIAHSGVDHIVLTFRGALRPGFHPLFGDPVPLAAGLSVLKSTLTAASGTAATISGGNNVTLPTGGNNLEVNVRDLVCLGPDDPTFTFWNLKACQGGQINGLQISTPGAWSGSPTLPTHTNSYGIKLPQKLFANNVTIDGLAAGGFYTGVRNGELCVYHGPLILGPSYYGIEIPETNYPSLIIALQATNVVRVINVTGAPGAIENHMFDVLQYARESPGSGSFATEYDLYDPSNYGVGYIRWFAISSAGIGSIDSFLRSGGANVTDQPIGSDWGTGSIDDILDLLTAETDASLVLAPDGAGGVEFRAEAGGALDDLSDATITTPAAGEQLRWTGSAWVNDAGAICVDAGIPTYDVGSPPGITIATDWGVDGSGMPYYDDGGATAGEEAALFYDPLTDHYFLIAYEL